MRIRLNQRNAVREVASPFRNTKLLTMFGEGSGDIK